MLCTNRKRDLKNPHEGFGQCSSAQLFPLQEEAKKASQGADMSMEFFTKMKRIWYELDNANPLPCCTCTENFLKGNKNRG